MFALGLKVGYAAANESVAWSYGDEYRDMMIYLQGILVESGEAKDADFAGLSLTFPADAKARHEELTGLRALFEKIRQGHRDKTQIKK